MRNQDLLKDYLNNEGRPEEMEAVTGYLIRQKLDGEARERWRRNLSRRHGIHRDQGRGRLRPMLVKVLAVAAAVALLGLVAWQLLTPAPQNPQLLADQYLAIPFDHAETRKGPLDYTRLRKEASRAYAQRDFALAVERWEDLAAQTALTEEDNFYLGLSYLYQDRAAPEAAIPRFKAALDMPEREYTGEAKWFLALAYLKAQRMEAARETFREIVTDESWNAEKAVDFLEILGN